MNPVPGAGQLVAALRSSGRFQLQVGNSRHDSGMDGIRGAAGIQIQIESVRSGDRVVNLPTSPFDLGRRGVMQTFCLVGWPYHRNHSQLERLLIMTVAVGAIEGQGKLGRVGIL